MGKKFDVIIVGGGPAGSTCAYYLAKSGAKVALFDDSHPREKPCGGGVPKRFFDDFEVPEHVPSRVIDWIIVEDQHGHMVKLPQKFGGVTIMRRDFDHSLFLKAKKSGAVCIEERVISVQEKDGWIVKTGKGTYECDLLVGADGYPSLVRRTIMGEIPRKQLALAAGYHIPHDTVHMKKRFEDAIELYFLGEPYVKTGYVWIFPKLDYVTVGMGTALGSKNIKRSLDRFVRTHPAARRIIMPDKVDLHSHMIPLANSPRFFDLPTSGKNWVLIGDSAGHVNPITGEGIYYAMMGGKLAAKAYLEGDVKKYERYWRKEYGGDMYWGSRLKNFFYKPKVIDIAIEIGKRSDTMRDILADVIASRVSYDRLIFAKIPVSLAKIIFEVTVSLLKKK
ncbi:MAG: geranylgeranyl reductase family protein [Candidatus Aenigmarchaeota archaeon]|nr:geranylgeranyl reductase family protein [Candidatus Aenigmarchaeota archaeon]